MALQDNTRRRMVLNNTVFILLAGICFACSPTPNAAEPVKTPEQQAENLFIMHCAACHGEDGKLGASGAKNLALSKLSDPEIKKILKIGKNGMPPMNELLGTPENINLVITHLKKLRN